MDKLNKMFEKYVSEEIITEETQKELSVVFESMVNEAVEKKTTEIEVAVEAKYGEMYENAVVEAKETAQTQINDYMKLVVSEFVAENKVAIQNSIVVEKAKNIIDGVQAVFIENGINLPDSDDSIVESINAKNVSIEADYNKSVDKIIELEKVVEEHEKAVMFIQKTNDMTDVSKEKLKNIMEGLSVNSTEEFGEKMDIIIKSVLEESVNSIEDENVDDEVVNENKDKKSTDSKVSSYMKDLRKIQNV